MLVVLEGNTDITRFVVIPIKRSEGPVFLYDRCHVLMERSDLVYGETVLFQQTDDGIVAAVHGGGVRTGQIAPIVPCVCDKYAAVGRKDAETDFHRAIAFRKRRIEAVPDDILPFRFQIPVQPDMPVCANQGNPGIILVIVRAIHRSTVKKLKRLCLRQMQGLSNVLFRHPAVVRVGKIDPVDDFSVGTAIALGHELLVDRKHGKTDQRHREAASE